MDVLVSAALLVVTFPVQCLVGLLVRADLGRPVFFRQARPGRHGQIFELVKFRTMRVEDPAAGPLSDDSRLSRLGRLLRATSLDELPTLWNVLRGDMSLVGPRPLLVQYLSLYTAEQARRHEVRPGVTGLAQVNGRNALPWEDRLALDVEYVNRRSLTLDLRILGLTIGAVIRRTGITDGATSTMTEFRGAPR